MTPQYILRKSLCRKPHCSNLYDTDREQYLRRARAEIENMDYALSYAERGYTHPEKGILFADWNVFPSNIDAVLERYGYAVEWSDEWTTCGECGNAVRTKPDGWDWRPYYDESGIEQGELVCLDCYAPATVDSDDD